jgi:hypothetical protein
MSGPSNPDAGSSQPMQNGIPSEFKVYKPPNRTVALPSTLLSMSKVVRIIHFAQTKFQIPSSHLLLLN